MREWIAAVPGACVEVEREEGKAFPETKLREPSGPTGAVALLPISDAQRVADLTPTSDEVLEVPAWLSQFASAAAAGEDLWG
jgi:hypothetical protein